jgi:hypothetical protein
MAAGDYVLPLNGELFSGTAGSTPSTERDNVDEVRLRMTGRTAEAVRRKKSWVAKKITVREATLEFKAYDIESDAFVTALASAFMNGTKIALYPTSYSGGPGLDADFYVTGFSRDENNTEIGAYNVTAEPTDELRDPNWV